MCFLNKKKYILKIKNLVARGGYRGIFLHECFPEKCLKVVIPSRRSAIKQRSNNFVKNLRPTILYDENVKDIRAYNRLKNKESIIYNYLPKFYGIVKTNLGRAIVVDYISNAITLEKYLQKYGLTDKIVDRIKDFFKIFYKYNIQIRDQNLSNYLIKILDNGELELKLIDGVGDCSLFSINTMIPYFGRKKILIKIDRFIEGLENLLPHYTEIINKINLKEYVKENNL